MLKNVQIDMKTGQMYRCSYSERNGKLISLSIVGQPARIATLLQIGRQGAEIKESSYGGTW
jgi:hypothetical protein